jgi:hypothetical protein
MRIETEPEIRGADLLVELYISVPETVSKRLPFSFVSNSCLLFLRSIVLGSCVRVRVRVRVVLVLEVHAGRLDLTSYA